MATPKVSTWTVTNSVRKVHPKASLPTDIAVTVTGDSIVKNSKATDGKTINLTVAHIRSGATIVRNEQTRVTTIRRTESPRGRKQATDAGNDTFNAFLTKFAK
jgi:hypothetical protein